MTESEPTIYEYENSPVLLVPNEFVEYFFEGFESAPISIKERWNKGVEEALKMWREDRKSKMQNVKLEPNHIKAAETVLSKGYCVELRPVKGEIKVIQVIRQQITEKSNKSPPL